jgi:hypothetical protein
MDKLDIQTACGLGFLSKRMLEIFIECMGRFSYLLIGKSLTVLRHFSERKRRKVIMVWEFYPICFLKIYYACLSFNNNNNNNSF